MVKCLIIDDDSLVRNTIVRILERKGHQVVTACDGRVGLKLFQQERPDVVVTDIIMPDKEGIETIREIRNLAPNAKIIAISGGARVGNVDFLAMAAKLGASETLCKPFDPDDLVTCINRCLESRDAA